MAIAGYLAMDYLLSRRRSRRLSLTGYFRAALLFLILATGILLVYRNLPGYRFSPPLVVALDFSHLGLVMLFLLTSLGAKLMKKGWLVYPTIEVDSHSPNLQEKAQNRRR